MQPAAVSDSRRERNLGTSACRRRRDGSPRSALGSGLVGGARNCVQGANDARLPVGELAPAAAVRGVRPQAEVLRLQLRLPRRTTASYTLLDERNAQRAN